MSARLSTIRRVTLRGGRQQVLEANGDARWRRENPETQDHRPLGIGLNSLGDVEFRFSPPRVATYGYVVTLTPDEVRRAAALIAELAKEPQS